MIITASFVQIALDALSPDFVGGKHSVGREIDQGVVRHAGGVLGGHAAEDPAGQVGVGRGLPARSRALAAKAAPWASWARFGAGTAISNVSIALAVHAAGVGTGQADAAPEVGRRAAGKAAIVAAIRCDVGPLDEPEAPAQPLVEGPPRVAREPAQGLAGAPPDRASRK